MSGIVKQSDFLRRGEGNGGNPLPRTRRGSAKKKSLGTASEKRRRSTDTKIADRKASEDRGNLKKLHSWASTLTSTDLGGQEAESPEHFDKIFLHLDVGTEAELAMIKEELGELGYEKMKPVTYKSKEAAAQIIHCFYLFCDDKLKMETIQMKSIKEHLPAEESIMKETLNFHYCPDAENGQRTTGHYTTQSALAACTVYEKDGIALTNMTPQQKSVDTFAKAVTKSPVKSAVQVEVEKSPGYTSEQDWEVFKQLRFLYLYALNFLTRVEHIRIFGTPAKDAMKVMVEYRLAHWHVWGFKPVVNFAPHQTNHSGKYNHDPGTLIVDEVQVTIAREHGKSLKDMEAAASESTLLTILAQATDSVTNPLDVSDIVDYPSAMLEITRLRQQILEIGVQQRPIGEYYSALQLQYTLLTKRNTAGKNAKDEANSRSSIKADETQKNDLNSYRYGMGEDKVEARSDAAHAAHETQKNDPNSYRYGMGKDKVEARTSKARTSANARIVNSGALLKQNDLVAYNGRRKDTALKTNGTVIENETRTSHSIRVRFSGEEFNLPVQRLRCVFDFSV